MRNDKITMLIVWFFITSLIPPAWFFYNHCDDKAFWGTLVGVTNYMAGWFGRAVIELFCKK